MNIGPGAYNVASTKQSKFGKGSPAFKSKGHQTIDGFKDYSKGSAPAPGDYSYKIGFDNLKNGADANANSSFGTSEKRFMSPFENRDIPGPGEYSFDVGHKKKKTKYHAGFLANAKRDTSLSPKNISTQLQYNLQNYKGIGTSHRIEGGAPNNFLYLKHPKLTLPFGSSGPRFDAQMLEAAGKNENGPGSYFFEKQSNPRKIGGGMLGKDKRFEKEGNNKEPVPGPGFYNDESQNWEKKSHNLRFKSRI